MGRRNTEEIDSAAPARHPVNQLEPDATVRLLLVFPDASLVREAVRSGLDVSALANPADALPLPDKRVFHPADGEGTTTAVARLTELHGFTHVLDADGRPASAPRLLADPRAFHQALTESSRAAARERTVETAEELPAAVTELGGAVIIDDTDVITTPDALAQWIQDHPSGPVTAAELITGTDLVVTTLTVNGMHRVVGITEQRPHHYVYPATLPDPDERQVRAAVTGMLDLLDYEFGPVHTHVVLAGGEPHLIRATPGFNVHRTADLLETATGFDVRTELFRALAGAPLDPPRPRWFAAVAATAPATEPPAEGISAEAALANLTSPRPE